MSRVDAQMQALVARGQVAIEAAEGRQNQRAEAVGEGFEALLLREMVSAMRATVPKSSLFPGHTGQDIYDHMMDQALSDHLAAGGGLGLAGLVDKQLGVGTSAASEPVQAAPHLMGAATTEHTAVGDDPIDTTANHMIPLADRLPPQRDDWLGESNAAHHLRTLVGEGITGDRDDLPTGTSR